MILLLFLVVKISFISSIECWTCYDCFNCLYLRSNFSTSTYGSSIFMIQVSVDFYFDSSFLFCNNL